MRERVSDAWAYGASRWRFCQCIAADRPTVCLDVMSLVASSCGYERGHIEPYAAHEFAVHIGLNIGEAVIRCHMRL